MKGRKGTRKYLRYLLQGKGGHWNQIWGQMKGPKVMWEGRITVLK